MIKDMTQGNPTRMILTFALPLLIGNIFQQLYNMVDSIVVGNFVGKIALAAVGSSFTLMTFFSAIIIGLCMGTSVVLSQFFGAQDYEKLRRSISTSFIFMAAFTIILSVVTTLCTRQMLVLMQTPADVLGDAVTYLRVILMGLFFTFLYNFGAAVLRAVGDSKTPLYFLIFACVVNIVLDLVFVLQFQMGVLGVALATIIAQGVSSVLCLCWGFYKVPLLRLKKADLCFDKTLFSITAKYSFLTSMQQSIMTFGMVCVQGLVNTFGPDTMAAFTAGGKVDSLAYLPVQDFGNAFATYVAQNKGADRWDRIRQGVRSAVKTIIIFCAISSTIILLTARFFIGLFVEPGETEVIRIGMEYLHVVGIFYVLIGFLFMFYGYFRGFGGLMMSVVLTVVSLGTRVLLAYVLAAIPAIGASGIWWAIPIGWGLADIIGVIAYKKSIKSPEFFT